MQIRDGRTDPENRPASRVWKGAEGGTGIRDTLRQNVDALLAKPKEQDWENLTNWNKGLGAGHFVVYNRSMKGGA